MRRSITALDDPKPRDVGAGCYGGCLRQRRRDGEKVAVSEPSRISVVLSTAPDADGVLRLSPQPPAAASSLPYFHDSGRAEFGELRRERR